MSGGTCEVCGNSANQRCAKCHQTNYCSKDHQRQHWKVHRLQCSPYRVCQNEVLGRYLEASRDIQPGEVIMKDTPLVLGPRQVTVAVCLGCFSPVTGSYTCTQCGWPMCGAQCQKSPLHIPECQLSRERGSKIQVSKFGEENQMYECITPLRCLWLRDRDCNQWATLMQMESHLEQRRGTEIHDLNQVNVVDFIQRYLNVHSFTDEEVQNVCGIIDVNGFEIPAQATALIGLYGKACLLEHNCIPNTTRTFDAQLNIVIRAAVMITKGSHIATSYTDPMWGTADRQMHLRTTKYFGCECERCKDPTELGTHLSSLRCGQCSGGAVLPSPSPLHPHLWCCVSCQATLPLHQVNAYLKQTGEKLVTLKDNPITASESYLKSTSTRLHENHYYRSDVKLALAQMYGHRGGDGRQQQNLLCDLSKDTLERKERLCREVLALADVLCPGESRLRALLLYELQSVWREQHRRLPRKLRNSPKSKTLLQECEGALKVASKVLQREAPLQDEYQLGLQAEAELHELSSLITKLFR